MSKPREITLPLLALLTGVFLFAGGDLAAQDLRLSDVLSTGTVEEMPPEPEEIETELEPVPAEDDSRTTGFESLAARAHVAVMDEDYVEAAEHLEAIFETGEPERYLSPVQLIEAAEVWVHLLEGRTAQQALSLVDQDELSDSEMSLYKYWYLESLLIEDQPNLDVAPAALDSPLGAAIEFRRALLLDLRGESAKAIKVYRELDALRNGLPAAERGVLMSRLAAFAS